MVKDIVGQKQWRTDVLESEKPVVVDFWAPWCAPCRMMTPVLETASATYKDLVRFAKVNTESNPQLARDLNIRSIPTLIIFYQGEVFDVSVGVTPAHRLHRMIRGILDKHEGVGVFEKLKRFFKKGQPGKAKSPDLPPKG